MGSKLKFTTILIIICSKILVPLTTATLPGWKSWLQRHHLAGWPRGYRHRDELQVGFYDYSCPQAEDIIEDVTRTAFYNDPGLASAFMRLYFHDCFVNGCDASILLDSTPSGEQTEKTSLGNYGVRGFEVIDEIKVHLEHACPETVSCADIISFVTHDAVTHSGLPHYRVPAGRCDGLTSIAKNIIHNLPPPNATVEYMEKIFTKKGMNKKDLVALLGSHSIGIGHCSVFDKQFHNFNSTFDINPKIDKVYANVLKKACPRKTTTSKDNILPLNAYYEKRLSNVYYSNVIRGRAVMPADLSLLDDPYTRKLVHLYGLECLIWFRDFCGSMIKLGKVDVLTGEQGQIRRSCRVVNK